MKIDKKRKLTRRTKRQRNNQHVKKATKNSKSSSYVQNNEINTQHSTPSPSVNDVIVNSSNNTISFVKLITIALTLLIIVTLVSMNFKPIMKFANQVQQKDDSLYPVLTKYVDNLRVISSRLTVVTRRVNMLSLVSEGKELNNISRINAIVLQINDMWYTTKKYLNYIGIETIAQSEFEKEIEENSKLNDKGVIREVNTEEVFKENEITLTNILKLDTIILELNSRIDSLNNEITFLEDNVYATIKVSHIYSQLLQRSRNTDSELISSAMKKQTTKQNLVTPSLKISNAIINNPVLEIKSKPNKQLIKVKVVSNKQIQPNSGAKATQKVTSNKQTQLNTVAKATQKVASNKQTQLNAVTKETQSVNKIIGAFTVKEKAVTEKRKDQSNKLSKKIDTKTERQLTQEPIKEKLVITEEPFVSPSLLDDDITDFVSNYDDYGDLENKNNKAPKKNLFEDDDDYTGG